MSLDHETSERAYQALKRDILAGWVDARPVNISALARRYGTSATPVREALLRLVGERLVELPGSGGFRVGRPDGARLRDLYELNMHLLIIAARMPESLPARADGGRDHARLAPAIDLIFTRLAESTGNHVLADLVAAMNDRLHQARLHEQQILTGLAIEASRLEAARGRQLVSALTRYHRRRIRVADHIAAP